MKKITLLFLVLLVVEQVLAGSPFDKDAGGQSVQLNNRKIGHLQNYSPADEPDVYYFPNDQLIAIDGWGLVSYYDVEIMSMTTWNTVITTQVNGTYDTIDVSSLASDDYLIVITTPNDNEYEGEFSVP